MRKPKLGMTHKRHDCTCLLCKPVEGLGPHPIYGYDIDRAMGTTCDMCHELIGDEPFVESLYLARFGAMFAVHLRCETKSGRRTRHQLEANWRRREKMKHPEKNVDPPKELDVLAIAYAENVAEGEGPSRKADLGFLLDFDIEDLHAFGWTCGLCPRRLQVKSRRMECNALDCLHYWALYRAAQLKEK